MGVCLAVGFCVLFGFVVLGLFWFSNCLIPFSSHKSCGDFQVLVKGHWTYSWAYVWVCRVSHVSLTWTAGILEISCSLRGKKNSDMSPSSEHPIPTYPMQVDETLQEIEWQEQEFFTALSEGFLPQDDTQRFPFDHTMHYEIGDPHTSGGGLPRVYDQSTEVGGPDWQQLFQYLLRQCTY